MEEALRAVLIFSSIFTIPCNLTMNVLLRILHAEEFQSVKYNRAAGKAVCANGQLWREIKTRIKIYGVWVHGPPSEARHLY